MTTLLDDARVGFLSVDVPTAVREAALDNLKSWLNDDTFAEYGPAIAALVQGEAFSELLDAFYQVLPFGTGGRRGNVGVGPNRMNPWTVATSVQGHAKWLTANSPGSELHVVLAYDVRRFDDARGIYGTTPTPVTGLSSRDFAELAARVYAANGVHAHLLPRQATYYLSTPELSFTIRALGAAGGVNLSASHNPPDDNGVKVYDDRGAQLVPPHDQHLLDEVAKWSDAKPLSWQAMLASGFHHELPASIHTDYIAAVAALAKPGPRNIRLGYTPLHGTGCVHEVLRAAGFACELHDAQAKPDGAFPTVPGHVANPENPEAMRSATDALDVDLVFGTDPDADRIGCEVKHDGAWVHLSGNDIGALITHWAVQAHTGPKQPLVIQTEVTSQLVARVATAGGAVVIDDLLVGFKYVGEVLRCLEVDGHYYGIHASDVTYVAGLEESHGVLMTDIMRDKDAAGGAVALAALGAEAAARGETLVDVLVGLKRAHGNIGCTQVSVRFEGATGASQMSALLDRLRSSPPQTLGGRNITARFDHRDTAGRFGAIVSDSDYAGRNVLVFHLAAAAGDDGARVILRPSGTEPKLKLYLELQGRAGLDAHEQAGIGDYLQRLADGVRATLLDA